MEGEEREEIETKVLELLESKLGLAEKHRDALRSFIETIFTDPKKILQVKDLDNRVHSLERQNNVIWAALGGVIVALLAVVVVLVIGG